MQLPVPAKEFIPHRNSMLLVDTLVSAEDGCGTIETRLPQSCIAAEENGTLAPLTLVELIAQAYAAVKGWELAKAGVEFDLGYLVGVQKFSYKQPTNVDELLTVNVETYGEFDSFAIVEGTVLQGETVLATGKIKLWVPPKEDA
jgi:predicted hotdog family 3-hydroxylacyl-ACP dehydratase